MVVHICCSVDSHYFLQKLKNSLNGIIGFCYNPNIHPKSEYNLRLQDVKKSCEMLKIPLIEGEYGYEFWQKATSSFEKELEGGKRCIECFDLRMIETAKLAKRLNIDKITSTLLMSPKKSLSQTSNSANLIKNMFDIDFFVVDYRKEGGTNQQFKEAKEANLYHQNYCGCFYALNEQRKKQNKLNIELFSPIQNQMPPNSIEEKMKLYQNNNPKFKTPFLNYRLLRGYIKAKDIVIDSFIFSYSKSISQKSKIDFDKDGIFILKNGSIIIKLQKFNKIFSTNYDSILELIKNPPPIKSELDFRERFFGSFNTSPIFVLKDILDLNFELFIESQIYEDIRENLITF